MAGIPGKAGAGGLGFSAMLPTRVQSEKRLPLGLSRPGQMTACTMKSENEKRQRDCGGYYY